MMADRSDPFEFLRSLRKQDESATRNVQQAYARQGALQRRIGGAQPRQGGAPADGSVGASQEYARQKLAAAGLGGADFEALKQLWQKESGWNPNALNRSSGAHGITQMMPMHGRREGAQSQIDWGIDYILRRYGSPSRAWQHSQQTNWY